MASQGDLKAKLEVLSNIHRVASSMSRQLNIRQEPSTVSLSNPIIPNLILTFPHDILTPLSGPQIPDLVRQDLLQCFSRRIGELQQHYVNTYRRAYLATAQTSSFDSDLQAVHRVYQALYQKECLPMISSWVSFALARVARHKPVPGDPKRPFNTDYTPVLEKYFEINAYPSAKHQDILAEKSMMTRRQIEVWFQNHRNRAKKEDKVLKRYDSASDHPLQVAFSALNEGNSTQTNRSPSPSDDDSASESMDEDEDLPQPTSCIEGPYGFRPQHAFPTTYPPTCDDPFPAENGVFKFPPPIWMRRPVSSAPPSMKSPAIDMDEFAKMFHSKLNILEGTRQRAATKCLKSRKPWFADIVTNPFPAPHPAFVRPSNPSRPSSTLFPTSSNVFSFQFPVGSHSTSTSKAFLSPPQHAASSARKMSPLPRRLPRSPSTAPSSPKSLSASSRSSSFSSDSSSRSRILSSSRNSTPEPSTPPQLPSLDIPAVQDAGIDQQISSEFDFSALFGDDPDLFPNMPPENFDISDSMNPMLNKQTHAPLFDFNSFLSIPTSDFVQAQP